MQTIHKLLFLLALSLTACQQQPQNLVCYVGGTMRPAMEEIINNFQTETGIKVDVDYGGSGELLTRIEQTQVGDLLVVHDPFFAETERKQLAYSGWTAAYLTPVIIVPKGNPRNIQQLSDLAQGNLKVIFTDPVYSTTGYLMKSMFRKMDSATVAKINSNVVSYTRGGYEAANAVILKTADVTIAWDAVAFLRKDEVDIVPIAPELMPKPGVDAISSATFGNIDISKTKVTLTVLNYSKNKEVAEKLAKYIVSEKSKAIWQKSGFQTPNNEEQLVVRDFSKEPLFIYCGAGLRKVMDKIIPAFEKSYKKPVNITYDGSNRLLGQLKLTQKGDVFIPGDAGYVRTAVSEGLIDDSISHVAYFIPVILTNRKSEANIKSLDDMLKKGVKIGQGDFKSAAVGKITNQILAKNNISEQKWNANVVLNTATVNELGLAINFATIDAAIIWRTIAIDYLTEGVIVEIPKDKNVIAQIEAGIIKNSTNKEAAQEFIKFITSDRGKEIFIESGYDLNY